MKTAMQEFIEKLSMKSGDTFYALTFYHDNDEIIKEALEKEKKQIIDPVNRLCDFYGHEHIGEQMYNTRYVEPKLKPIYEFQMPEKEIEARNIIQDLKDRHEKD